MDIINSVKLASDSVGFIRKMFDGYVDGLSKEMVAELQQQANQKVIDIQQALLDIQARSLELQEENKQLKESLRKHDEINNRLEDYTLTGTEGGAVVFVRNLEPKTYVCPTCVETSNQVHMLQFNGNHLKLYKCKNCDSEYKIGKTEKVNVQPVPRSRGSVW